MSLRRRLALLSGAAVAITVLLASVTVYALVRDRLRDQVDDDLRGQADRTMARLEGAFTQAIDPGGAIAPGALGGIVARAEAPPGQGAPMQGGSPTKGPTGSDQVLAPLPPPAPGTAPALGQIIGADGTAISGPGAAIKIPVSSSAREVAAEAQEPKLEDVDVGGGTTLRVLTQPLVRGAALQVASSLEPTNDTLSSLVVILFLVSAGGVAAAAALGPVVARTAMAPAGEVSDAAEEVARTHDLTRRIDVRGSDELGRLAASFNEMMAALERSESAQRRLVADASHELRTPLATLRTNIETLGRREEIDPVEREQLVGDVTDELEEMTELVADVVELARLPGEDGGAVREDVALDELARDAVERSRRRARELRFAGADLALVGARGPPAAGAGDLQHARQRLQVEPPRGRGGDRGGRRPGGDPRPRPWILRGGPAAGVRSLLALGRGSWQTRLGAGPGDRPAGGRGARGHGEGGERQRRRCGGQHRAPRRAAGVSSRFLGRSQAALRLAWLDLGRARRDRGAKPKEW